MIELLPYLVPLLSGSGVLAGALRLIDRERDRRFVRDMATRDEHADLDASARALRALRWRKIGDCDTKPAVEASKPTLTIEASKPDAPPGTDPSRAA